MIRFYLNGQRHELSQLNPNTTVLEYLRLHARQTDTKEGCGSGDCGACTIMVQRLPDNKNALNTTPFYTLNSCITLLSLMDGHHILTAAYLADNPKHHPERALLHPAQQALVDCHGSQCGFCTPGFVMSLASVYENRRLQRKPSVTNDESNKGDLNSNELSSNDFNSNELSGNGHSSHDLCYDEIVAAISGNLCRCTGYRPIIEAGLAMEKIGQQREADRVAVKDLTLSLATDAMASTDESFKTESLLTPALAKGSRQLFIPQSIHELDQLLAIYPKATLWAGGTDLGLSVTQHLVDHETIIQLSAVDELKTWSLSKLDGLSNSEKTNNEKMVQELTFGAGMTYRQMLPILEQYYPEFAALFARTASPQIRNMGTLGGNIANASPIGDLPPILLALQARIHLRHCDLDTKQNFNRNANNIHSDKLYVDETIPLADFFIDYKKTKLRAGSYIVALHMPLMQDNQHLFIHKISKRYEDDISACLFAASLVLSADGATIEQAKIGLGGMAATPLLAKHCQQALIGMPVEMASFVRAAAVLPLDVTPMTDVRASREYRMHVVQRLLLKYAKQLINRAQIESA